MSDYSDDILSLEPLMDRLDRIEARMSSTALTAPAIEAAEFDSRLLRQAKEIEALQLQLTETRQKLETDASKVQRHFTEITREVPAMLESLIGSHFSAIRDRVDADTKEAIDGALAGFERAFEKRVSARVSTLEKALVDQSGIITTLSERALDADANMQRLISAVEKLCERTEGRPLQAALPVKQPTGPAAGTPARREFPFETQLSDAMNRQQGGLVQYPDSGFRPKIITEAEAEKQRHRKPLTRL